MIAIVDIVLAAAIGVALATLFEGRWGPLLVAPPLLGVLHAVLILLPDEVLESDKAAAFLHILAQLDDPWLLVAVIVASASGSVFTAMMLAQSRESKTPAFWLPDMDQPKTVSRRQVSALVERVERAAPGRARRLVEEGYGAGEEQPVFDAAVGARVGPSALAEPRQKALDVAPEANKRRAARRRVLLAGRLSAEGGISVACVIQNLSTTGAAVRVQGSVALPRLVSLIDVTNGIGHKAQVRWRFRDMMGLRFLNSFDLSAPEGPEAQAMASQWGALKV